MITSASKVCAIGGDTPTKRPARPAPSGGWALAGVAFIWRELVYRQPIVSLRPFADCSFSLGIVMTFVSGMSLFGGTFLSLYLGQVRGFSAAEVGATMLTSGLTMAALATILSHQTASHYQDIASAVSSASPQGQGMMDGLSTMMGGLSDPEGGARKAFSMLARFLAAETRAGRLACPDPMEAAEFFGGMVVSTRQTALMLGMPRTLTEADLDHIAWEAARRFLRAYAP